MRKKEDIDKILRTIEDVLIVYPDVVEAKISDDKITLLEGGALFIKHSGKAFRFVAAVPEIGCEIIDLDSGETTEIFDKLSAHFGGTEEVNAALRKIANGTGELNQGIQDLIEAKKNQ